jgi:hypothetical protein
MGGVSWGPLWLKLAYNKAKSSNKGHFIETPWVEVRWTWQSHPKRGRPMRPSQPMTIWTQEILVVQWHCSTTTTLSGGISFSIPQSLISSLPRMTSPSSCYTDLFPKRPNITGDADQAYHCRFRNYFGYLISGIGADTIATIGTIAPGSTSLTYIYAPQIHTNLGGRFKSVHWERFKQVGKIQLRSHWFFRIWPFSLSSPLSWTQTMPSLPKLVSSHLTSRL